MPDKRSTVPDKPFRRCASWLLAFTLILPAATVGVLAGEGPAVTLGSTNEYRLLPITRVRNPEALAARAEWGLGTTQILGQLLVEGEADDIGGAHFAVEHEPDRGFYPDGGPFEVCNREYQYPDCFPVGIGLRGEGLLYVYAVGIDSHWEDLDLGGIRFPTSDFPVQRVEVSASLSSGLKVHKDVLVKRPAGAPDCSDYPDMNEERYLCLYGWEVLPPASSLPNASALIAGLPDTLVQDKNNYELVFAEEFDGQVAGAGPATNCDGGFLRIDGASLDPALWNYKNNNCDHTDASGKPHETIANGQYVMGRSSSTHGGDKSDNGLTTAGKFHPKYGYTEIRYEVDLNFSSLWQNMAMVYGISWHRMYTGTQRRFGIFPPDSYRDFSTRSTLEIDLVEYVPSKRRDIFHQYINHGGLVARSNARPTRSVKSYSYCGNEGRLKFWLDDCTGTVTVTKGMEWTPRGYRSFYRVHGLHDELKVLKKSEIQVQRKGVTSAPGEPVTFGSYSTVTGSDRNPYFEFTDADDPDTVLEKVAISHMPSPLEWFIWSYSAPDNVHTFFRLDYIRVFQPRNRYADMDPVYQ